LFVRWKKKYRNKGHFGEMKKLTLCAVIVENVRTGNKVKQNIVKYLCGIREEDIERSFRRKLFWIKVKQKLDTLDLNKEDIASIEYSLQQVVAMPDKEDSSIKRAYEIRKRLKVTANS